MTISIPGARTLPPFGGFGSVLRFTHDPIGFTGHLFALHGNVVAASTEGGSRFTSPSMPPLSVFMKGRGAMHALLSDVTRFHKYPLSGRYYPTEAQPSGRRLALSFWEAGLFKVNGEVHRRERRLVMPAFHKGRVETYHAVIAEEVCRQVEEWREGGMVEVHRPIMRMTMEMTSRTLFGIPTSDDTNVSKSLFRARSLATKTLTAALPFDVPGLPYHEFLGLVGDTDSKLRKLIRDARNRHDPDAPDMLNALIHCRDEDGVSLTDDEIVGHASQIFGAGHETTSSALAWCLLLLSRFPLVQRRVREELSFLGGRIPDLSELERLPYLGMVLKESMRILTPAPFVARHVVEPVEVCGYLLPVGAEVFGSVFHTHRDPDLYFSPNAFIPERWEGVAPDPFAFVTFSAGPRMCLGAPLATMQMMMFLATLLGRFQIEFPAQRVDANFSFTKAAVKPLPTGMGI